MISPISRRTNFTTFEDNNFNRCRHVNFWNRVLKISPQRVAFPKKRKLATSGRHNSAIITDRRKFTTKWSHSGCLVFIFTVRINSKYFPWPVRSVQETYLPKFSATPDVRYCVLKPMVGRSAGAVWQPIYGRKADRIGN